MPRVKGLLVPLPLCVGCSALLLLACRVPALCQEVGVREGPRDVTETGLFSHIEGLKPHPSAPEGCRNPDNVDSEE